jgi:hypothetical protein
VVVNAHMLWLCLSDEQLDYLRYMLKAYPNLNVDLATVPNFLRAVGRENLLDLMIEYADRILFGTDMASPWFVPVLDKRLPKIREKVPQYQRCFEFLETDKELPSGIKDEHKSAAWRCRWTCWRRFTSATRCAFTRTSPTC